MPGLLSLITPTNLELEKARFFASPSYDPVFHYIWQDHNLSVKFSNKLKSNLWEAVKTQNTKEIRYPACSTTQKLFSSLMFHYDNSNYRTEVTVGRWVYTKNIFLHDFMVVL